MINMILNILRSREWTLPLFLLFLIFPLKTPHGGSIDGDYLYDCICIYAGSPGYYLFMIVYVIQQNRGNKNYPDSLNVMVNYHYHGEKRVSTR